MMNTHFLARVSIFLLALAAFAGVERSASAAPKDTGRPSDAPDNVLLITLDTTRADRIGCYGRAEAVTPTLDALAKRGTLFEQAFSVVPITLPSHASMLTGKYPREHGISDNGRERLAESHVTLANLAHDRGYKTGAFLASFVLDKRFGLARGFDVYNDDMGTHDRSTDPLHWEQPANVVTDRALAWLDSAKSSPFFCWVHYYDAHDPYAPPEAFKDVGANPYDGEIAFVDSQIRRLTDWLAQHKLDGKTLIVVVGDHGESFGEHREVGHTMFLYDTNIHVPMIFAHPKLTKPNRRISTVVEIVDVFPTVVELMNWKAQPGVHARSLVPALSGGDLDPGTAYSETLFGLHTYGWCEQRSLTTARWKYVSSVHPELFDRKADPDEKKNLVEAQPERAAEMEASLRQRFKAMPAGKADEMDYDERSHKALLSLGYTGGGGLSSEGFLTREYPDPKDNLEVVKIFMAGRKASREGDHDVALFHLYNAATRAPNSVAIQTAFGSSLLAVYDKQAKQANGVGDFQLLERAKDAFAKALTLDSMSEPSMASLGDVLMRQRRYEKAVEQYRLVLKGRSEYPEVHVKLATALRELGRGEEAVVEYKTALKLDPSMADAAYDLGTYYLGQDDPNAALRYLHEAVRFSPDEPTYRYNLGLALAQFELFEDAVVEFETAVELDPNFTDAVINLGVTQFQAGQVGPAQATLMRASMNPKMSIEAFYNLGVLMEKQNRPKVAIDFYQRATLSRPDHDGSVNRITGLLLSLGRAKQAAMVLRNAIAARPNDLAWTNTLAMLLATTKDDRVRSGSEAVTFAQRALSLAGGGQPDILRTLAAAQAETGAYDKAVVTVDRAIKLAEAAGRQPFVKLLRKERDAYGQGRSVRSDEY